MARLEIFELETPAPTGAMLGADAFARDLAWLETRGVVSVRHGLDRDRAAFDANELVRSTLETTGTATLPLVLVDDTILSAGAYPSRPELARALDLRASDDEAFLAWVAAAGVALGLRLAEHEPGAIEQAWQELRRLGLAGGPFRDAVATMIPPTGTADPQIIEALDRLCTRGSLRPPAGGCCPGRPG